MPQAKVHGTSQWQTTLHLIKGNVGPGCLALPFCFSLLGPFLSAFGVLFIGVVCVYNMWLLVECKKAVLGANNYGDIGFFVCGKYGRSIINSFLVFMQVSIGCVYVIFVGGNMQSALSYTNYHMSASFAMALVGVPLCFLVQIRSMRQLVPFSFAAFVFICIGMISIFVLCITRLSESADGDVSVTEGTSNWKRFVVFFCSIIYAFEGIGIVLPIENEMAHHSQPQADRNDIIPQEESSASISSFPHALRNAMSFVILLFIVFAEVCVGTLGNVTNGLSLLYDYAFVGSLIVVVVCCGLLGSITGFLLDQHSDSSPSTSDSYTISLLCVNALISLAILLSYPLQIYPVFDILFPSSNKGHFGASYTNIDDVSESVELTTTNPLCTGSCNASIEYQSIYLDDDHVSEVQHSDIDTSLNRSSFEHKDVERAELSSSHTLTFARGSDHDKEITGGRYLAVCSAVRWLLVDFRGSMYRIGIALFSVFVAILVPNVGLMIPLAGASSGIALALIFPSTIDLIIHSCFMHNNAKPSGMAIAHFNIRSLSLPWWRVCLNLLSIAMGIVGAAMGTFVAIENISKAE